MAKLTIIEAINQALHQEMEADKKVLVLGEDVGVDGGVFRSTEGLLKKFGPKRVLDTPLAEAGIIGTAIGMALYGMKPVAEIQFSGFMYLGLNQLISHAAKIRNRSRGRYKASIVVRAPHSGGYKALEHHSESTESYYIHTAGLKVVMPSTPYDAKGLLISAIRDPDPVIFLEPTRLYRAIREEVPEKSYSIPLGEAKVVREGTDISIVTWGTMVRPSLEAANNVAAQGISAEVIDLRTLSPFDEEAIIKSVQKTGRLVIVHEACKTLGLGAEISARVNEKALLSLEAPILRVTAPDVPYPLFKLEEHYLPNAKKIVNAINKVVKF